MVVVVRVVMVVKVVMVVMVVMEVKEVKEVKKVKKVVTQPNPTNEIRISASTAPLSASYTKRQIQGLNRKGYVRYMKVDR